MSKEEEIFLKKLKNLCLCGHCNKFFASQQTLNRHLKNIMESKKRSFENQIEEFRVVKARDISPEDLV